MIKEKIDTIRSLLVEVLNEEDFKIVSNYLLEINDEVERLKERNEELEADCEALEDALYEY